MILTYIRFSFAYRKGSLQFRTRMTKRTPASNPILTLQSKVGMEWKEINNARRAAEATSGRLGKLLVGLSSADTSIVVFGSLARREWTTNSDVDWTLLIDGQADPGHFEVARSVSARLRRKFPEPGVTGIFGNMTFSHDLIHKIGGREDTNENTTRRILLLLESESVGKPDAHERVLRLILHRYLQEDRGFRFSRALPFRVPRVLLNDLARYWRTVTVDFVEKQRAQGGMGWGLRNVKLRMSRKLIFATGLLSCFSCELLADSKARRELLAGGSTTGMEIHLRAFFRQTPLQILATFLLEQGIRRKTAVDLFSAYNSFLKLLNNPRKRNHLKNLSPDDIPGDQIFKEATGYGHKFQEALTSLFFRDNVHLQKLTTFYGVF